MGRDLKKQRRVVNEECITSQRREGVAGYTSQSTKRTEDLSRGRIERANVDTSNGVRVNVDAIDSAREVHPTSGVALKLVGSDEPKEVERVARECHPITQEGGVASELAAPGLTISGGQEIGSVMRNVNIVRGLHPIKPRMVGVFPTSSDCRKTTVSITEAQLAPNLKRAQ